MSPIEYSSLYLEEDNFMFHRITFAAKWLSPKQTSNMYLKL